jgi:hypothetical protein
VLSFLVLYFLQTEILKKKMHSISLILIGILFTITVCPYHAYGTTTENTELEEPKILPLTADVINTSNDDSKFVKKEFWQEDDGEVLIRNERGAKDNGSGSTTGKKQNKKDKNLNSMKNAPKQHTNKNPDTNSEIMPSTSTSTQETVKKHQQKHEKHEKNSNNNKKHANTEKPKHKDESKEN